MSSRSDSNTTDALAEGAAELTVAAFIVAAWLAVKGAELIIRVTLEHPHSVPLRVALALSGVSTGAVLATQGRITTVNLAAALALLTLLATAKAVELYHRPLMVAEWSRDKVAQAVLHEPWWAAA